MPCKCKFSAVWLHPETGKIWGGSAGKDRTEAGVRAHADQRVATWGKWDSYYRKYEIVCGQCVGKESLSAELAKRIAGVQFDQWAERAIKAILSQADINETLKKLIGAKASLEKPFKDYAHNLGERAKDLMTLQKELDRELLVHTSKLEELLDRASQTHTYLQANPLHARGFVYDKASGVFGYGSVDEEGAKGGPWNGWYLSEGEFSSLESGPFAFSGSFQKSRREGAWKLASRFPAMTLEGQFSGDNAHGAWTIRDGSGQSMSGSFEGGVWKGDASAGKAFANVMEPFAAVFGEPASTSAELAKSRLKAMDEHIATLRKESQDLINRKKPSIVSRNVDIRRTSAEIYAAEDRVRASIRAWHVAVEAARRSGYRTSSRSVWPNAPSTGVLIINPAAESNVRALREKWCQADRERNEYISREDMGDEYWRLTLMVAELSDAINDIKFERRAFEANELGVRLQAKSEEKVSEVKEEKKEEQASPCVLCDGSGICSLCKGKGWTSSIQCTTCNYARKISEVCGTCKGIPGNADCTRCRGTGKDDCGKCFAKDRMVPCDYCKGKGYKKIGKKKKDCGICDGRGKVPCSVCNSSCRECFGGLKVLCKKCQTGRVERDCDKCNSERRIETKCGLCFGLKSCGCRRGLRNR